MRRKEIYKALRLAGNSSPGPDGIPFSAWRALGAAGADILFEVAASLEREGSEEVMIKAYADECAPGQHGYNMSTLVCLPKAAAGEDAEFGVYYRPSDTRPLSIVNCDNRVVASAFRWRWEAHLDGFVRHRQQGFIRGRSILQNLIQVDAAMAVRSLEDPRSAAIFLDFEAAFPSMSQEYIVRVLEEVGLPAGSPGAGWR